MVKASRGAMGGTKKEPVPDIPIDPVAPPVEPEVKPVVPSRDTKKVGLHNTYVVAERAAFEELVVSLLHGYGDRFTAQSLPTLIMKMFALSTRDEAIVLLKELQQSKRERAANAAS